MPAIRSLFGTMGGKSTPDGASGKRVVLVAPPSPYPPHYEQLAYPPYTRVQVFNVNPLIPLGTAYLGASLEAAGFDVKVVDLTFSSQHGLSVDKVRDAVLDLNPDAVGLSSFTSTISAVNRIATALKEKQSDIPVVVGGPHASALPKRTLEEFPCFDAAIVGEGEEAFSTLLKQMLGKEENVLPLPKGAICRGKDSAIQGNFGPAYVEDLDGLPFPARHLFDLEKYKLGSSQVPTAKKHPIASIITSRGCPHTCAFCFHNGGYHFRARSPKNVLREVEEIQSLGFKEIQVFDDDFTQDQKRVAEICRLLKESGADMSFCLPNGVRVDTIEEKLLSEMFEVGFYDIHFGLESSDPYMLEKIRKGITLEQLKRAVHMAKEVGFRVTVYLVVGLPGTTAEIEEKNLEFAQESEADYVTGFLYTPYPGSALWNELSGKLADVPWERYNDGSIADPIYVPDGITVEQLQLWCRDINRRSIH